MGTNVQEAALQDRCKTNVRSTGLARESLPKAHPQPLPRGIRGGWQGMRRRLPLAAAQSSLKSGSGQANAAGGGRGRGRAEAVPHGRPGSGSLARWAGRGCGSRPLQFSRGRSCRSAPAGSEHSALGPLRRLQTASSLFSLSVLPRRPAGDFHQGLSTRSHVTRQCRCESIPAPLAAAGAAGAAPPVPPAGRREKVGAAPSRPAPPAARETPALRPGVSPRESPGHFGSWTPRHIHVEIAVVGTGNEIGSFSQPFSAENHRL